MVLVLIHSSAFGSGNLNDILMTLKSDTFVIKFQVYERNEFESTMEGSNSSSYDSFKGKTITLAKNNEEILCTVFDEVTGFEYCSLDRRDYHCNFYVKDGVFYDGNEDVDFIILFPKDFEKIKKQKNRITKMKNVPNTSLFDFYLEELCKNFSAIVTKYKYVDVNGEKVQIDYCDILSGDGYENVDNKKLRFIEFRTPVEYTPIEVSRYYFDENKFVKFIKIQDYKQYSQDVTVGGVKIIEFNEFSRAPVYKNYVFSQNIKFNEVSGYKSF